MNKMEITNHGRGLALTMGWPACNVCVLLGFVEGFCAEIDGFQCVCSAGIYWKIVCCNWWFLMCVFCWDLLKDYVLKLMVSICVFCWNLVTVYMLGLLQHVWCVSMPKCMLCSETVIRCRNWVFCSELAFATELCVVQRNYDSLPKLCRLQWISIRCRN